MPVSARLITSVPPDARERFSLIAAARGVSVSHLLARLVHTTIAETPEDKVRRLIDETMTKAPAEKYTVRLLGFDAAQLEQRAHARGMTPSGYVAHLLRAHLRADAPMPYSEFQELKRVVNELTGIRGALAQLLDRPRGASVDDAVGHNILKLLPALKQLREKVQAMLIANSKSWEIPGG